MRFYRFLTASFVSLAAVALISPVFGAEVAWYKFDEAPGATTAAPSIGSPSGALSGASAFVAGGISGNAVSTTRSGNGLVNFGNNFGFPSGSFSISFWQKTNTTEPDTVSVTKHFAGSQNGYVFVVGASSGGGAVGKETFIASTLVGNGVTSTTTITDNAWHQIVGVYNAGGTHSIYVDGAPAEQSKATAAIVSNAIPFIVGGVGAVGSGTPESRYTGLIDDLHIFDSALNDNEVQALFVNPGAPLPEPSALVSLGLIAAACVKRRARN